MTSIGNDNDQIKQYVIDDKFLMSEWDWENNDKLGLDPSKIKLKSDKKPYWICQYGHRWQTSVKHRSNGTNCPYCSGHLVIPGETDLATVNPSLAAEWHPTKNGDLTPKDVKPQSNKKVWWLCSNGHEYKSKINNRYNGNGCPACRNELHTSFPEQAIYFYIKQYFNAKSRENVFGKEVDVYFPDKNIGIEYDGEYFHSGEHAIKKELEKDRILDKNGIRVLRVKESNENNISDDTIYYIYNTKHSNLPWVIISLLEILGVTVAEIDIEADRGNIYELYIHEEKEQSLKSKFPKITKEWNYEKNGRLTPDMVRPASNKIVWWICEKNHEWQASIANRTSGNNCPICSGHTVLPGYNDLQTKYPDLALEWDYDKNKDLLPTSVMPRSGKKAWWICDKGHEWEARICTRAAGQGCPYCIGKQVLEGFNDLSTTNPELSLEWNFEKNTLLPTMVSRGSNKKVWWKCKTCGHEWQASIKNRNKGRGCPECARSK